MITFSRSRARASQAYNLSFNYTLFEVPVPELYFQLIFKSNCLVVFLFLLDFWLPNDCCGKMCDSWHWLDILNTVTVFWLAGHYQPFDLIGCGDFEPCRAITKSSGGEDLLGGKVLPEIFRVIRILICAICFQNIIKIHCSEPLAFAELLIHQLPIL